MMQNYSACQIEISQNAKRKMTHNAKWPKNAKLNFTQNTERLRMQSDSECKMTQNGNFITFCIFIVYKTIQT